MAVFTKENAAAMAAKSVLARRAAQAKRVLAAEQARSLELRCDSMEIELGRSTIDHEKEQRSAEVHRLLELEAVKQGQRLALKPVNKPADFKVVVDAADKLFGWSKTQAPSTLIQLNYMADMKRKTPQEQPAKPAIEPVRNV